MSLKKTRAIGSVKPTKNILTVSNQNLSQQIIVPSYVINPYSYNDLSILFVHLPKRNLTISHTALFNMCRINRHSYESTMPTERLGGVLDYLRVNIKSSANIHS